ncbi:MAG: aminoacyl--tRNA ligase-related protein, partial [Hyphomicrobiaceae bacterium]|nr:aminoacyl--tRNA ligase-related protein [Hyphomicrobiaceae bacterium]
MFDIKWIRDNPQAFDKGLERRGIARGGDIKFSAELLELDEARRAIVTRLQEAQARRNAASKEIGKAKAAKDEAKAAALMAEVATLKDEMAEGETAQAAADAALRTALAVIPNIPREEVPEGSDEHGNVEQRKVGAPPALTGINQPLQHFEIGERLGLMDFETAAKLSGARFVVLKGALARMERALGAFMLDIHTTEFGYTEVAPPILVRDDAMFGTAQLPKFREDQFPVTLSENFDRVLDEFERFIADPSYFAQISDADFVQLAQTAQAVRTSKSFRQNIERLHERNRFWLVPTAEVPLTNLVRESIRDEAELPIRVTAFTPCFRAEAGAAGRDTRGMIRQHQFSKVELVSITTPEQSLAEHERMTEAAETVLKRLGLAYRT